MFPSVQQLANTTFSYVPPLKRSSYALFLCILCLIASSLISLPLVKTTIAISSPGIIRPVNERTEVKPVIGGVIDTIYYHEGDYVRKGDIIIRMKDQVTKSKRLTNNFEISQHQVFIHDLQLLTRKKLSEELLSKLESPLYKEQLSRFLHQKADQDASLNKVTQDLEINTQLAKGKVVTRKELFETQVAYDKVSATYKAFIVEQQSNWQQDMARFKLELSQYREAQNQVAADASYFAVTAPVGGNLQGINTLYPGGILQPGEVLCTISPDGSLVAECYVSTKNIGLIRKGQTVRFQIDAFDYNYFGMFTGRVKSIDKDFTIFNNTSVFKVRCQFDDKQLHLKNGYTGQLQKGLTFQARFIIGERTLWQLLWDKADDWLNPAAPSKS